jgi:hypothetical protein
MNGCIPFIWLMLTSASALCHTYCSSNPVSWCTWACHDFMIINTQNREIQARRDFIEHKYNELYHKYNNLLGTPDCIECPECDPPDVNTCEPICNKIIRDNLPLVHMSCPNVERVGTYMGRDIIHGFLFLDVLDTIIVWGIMHSVPIAK